MLAFTEILKSHISEIKIDINPVRPQGRGELEARMTKFTAAIRKLQIL